MRIALPDVSSLAAMAETEAIGKGRRLYISKADLMHGLTEGCLGCRCLAEGKRAQGHEGCRTRLEAEIAKTDDGRARLTTAYLRSLLRDKRGGGPAAGVAAPAAVPAPPRPDGVQDERPSHASQVGKLAPPEIKNLIAHADSSAVLAKEAASRAFREEAEKQTAKT